MPELAPHVKEPAVGRGRGNRARARARRALVPAAQLKVAGKRRRGLPEALPLEKVQDVRVQLQLHPRRQPDVLPVLSAPRALPRPVLLSLPHDCHASLASVLDPRSYLSCEMILVSVQPCLLPKSDTEILLSSCTWR